MSAHSSVDDRLLAPWIANGTADTQDARLFAAAMISDPSLADDLAAAAAEQAEVMAMGQALGRPSIRPLLDLFAAIDAQAPFTNSNVTRMTFERPRTPVPHDLQKTSCAQQKKVGRC